MKRDDTKDMTNEEYFEALKIINVSFVELRSKGILLVKDIVGENLTQDDLFFCSALDRCLHLMDGLAPMLKARNLTCSGAIVRMQMDNCMRTYAAFIAADKEAVINCLIRGTPIRKEKDEKGNRMTDGYLKDEITKIDRTFNQVYDQASGYIHLSEKAFYQTVNEIDDDGKLTIQVGSELPEKRNAPLLECAEAFTHFIILHYKMLTAVAESKQRFDKAQNQCKII